MAETPQEVEINIVMGAQLRSIVRSALLHIRNKIKTMPYVDGEGKERVEGIIDAELVNWPLSTTGAPDRLPEWLYNRFKQSIDPDWEHANQEYWHWQAAATRRAVGRGGYRAGGSGQQPESERFRMAVLEGIGSIQQRHQLVGDLLQKYKTADQPLVSVEQIFDILCGTAAPDQFESALQVLPTGVKK